LTSDSRIDRSPHRLLAPYPATIMVSAEEIPHLIGENLTREAR
jgi:hypothetical protein